MLLGVPALKFVIWSFVALHMVVSNQTKSYHIVYIDTANVRVLKSTLHLSRCQVFVLENESHCSCLCTYVIQRHQSCYEVYYTAAYSYVLKHERSFDIGHWHINVSLITYHMWSSHRCTCILVIKSVVTKPCTSIYNVPTLPFCWSTIW